MTMWMISYRYEAVFKKRDGSATRTAGVDTIEILDEHPAKFLSRTKRDLLAEASFDNERSDDITRVYWTMELPDDVLLPHDVELFQ